MLKQLKLKHRIYVGFLSVGLIASVIAIVAIIGFYYVNHNFKNFLSFSEKATLISNIATNVAEIQRQALIYTYDGHENSAVKVHELYQGMVKKVNLDSEQESFKLEKINSHLKTYIEAFTQLEKQRKLQTELVYHRIRMVASEAEQHFDEFIMLTSSDSEQQLKNQHFLNALLSIEKYAMRYFDSLDASYIDLTKKAIIHAHHDLKQVQQGVTDSKIAQKLQIIDQYMNDYELVFLEAVQRKRGYLFLVNVVMSAEAYEVLYYSKKITANLQQEMARIENKTLTLMENVIVLIISASIIFIVLIALFSVLITKSITHPIMRLTAIFDALVKGSHQEVILYPVNDEIGALTQAATVFSDKNKQTEELLEKSKRLTQELERSNDELEQFVYTVSHDLKSPLVTSMGFIGIVQKLLAAGRIQEGVKKFDKIINANRRMGQLINDLLELSRVGRIDMDKKMLNLNQLLHTFYESNLLRLKNAEVVMNIEAELPTLYANESRLLQVFENLLSNVLKYGLNPEGTIIHIGKRETADNYLIYFKDNGEGIAKEYQQKIFGLFYRLNTDKEGTGIGLAVAVKVMKFHGGSIWVESEIGQGACFYLAFPKQMPMNEEV